MPAYNSFLTDTPEQLLTRKLELYPLIDRIAQSLEMPASRYQQAEERYRAVSDCLHDCSTLGGLNPHVFPQGSFALETTVRPLHGEEHDLDFICYLQTAHFQHYTQQQIYDYLYNRLKGHGTYASMVEKMNRCVRIIYANDFHLDITPAVRNISCSRGGLYVPDRKLSIWKASHPQGYVDWFKPIAALKPRLRSLEKAFSGRHLTLASTDPVPDQQNPRGILRRAVQFMKRHRDLYREAHPELADFAPISIIITTLAAKAYALAVSVSEYDSAFDVMNAVIELMPQFIEFRYDFQAGGNIYSVANPTTEGENFADKWKDHRYYRTFLAWHAAAQRDLRNLEQLRGRDELQKALRNSLGGADTDRVFSQQMQSLNHARAQQQISVPAPVRAGLVAAPALVVPRTDFFGK